MPPVEARTVAQFLIQFGVPEEPVARIEDRAIPGPVQPIRVRIYTPVLNQVLPVLVYFHGGGFVIGDLESHDRECRRLANLSGCIVVAVDYRLAPEHPFPGAVEDAYAATRYIAEHTAEFSADSGRIAVGGDSAGGNLAAVVSLIAREKGGPKLAFQLLVYPCTDATATGGSMREFAEGPFLTGAMMDWFLGHYFPRPEDRSSAYASPLKAPDFRGLPQAMVMTAEYDLLRDQGEAFAQKLKEAGVPVTLKRYAGMFHPFFSLGGAIDAAGAALADAATALRMALSPSRAASLQADRF
jgi:acetyl esterase